MLLSVNNQSPYKTAAGEVRCASNQLGTIFDFVKNNPNKRYNVLLREEEEISKAIEQIEFIKAVAEDYTIECGNIASLKALLELGYNAYLRFPVSDWETYQSLRELKVSDIYIDGALGFSVDLLAKSKEDIKLRSTPTISPNASLSAPAANHFFIRPEDIGKYTSAIDVLDLRQPTLEKENALFSVYQRGTFNFDIDNLIENVPAGVNNVALVDFAEKRLNCGQRCKIPGNHCKWCNTQFSFVDKATKYGKLRTN